MSRRNGATAAALRWLRVPVITLVAAILVALFVLPSVFKNGLAEGGKEAAASPAPAETDGAEATESYSGGRILPEGVTINVGDKNDEVIRI